MCVRVSVGTFGGDIYTNIWLYHLSREVVSPGAVGGVGRGPSGWTVGQKKVHEHPFRALIFTKRKSKQTADKRRRRAPERDGTSATGQ